MKEAVIVSAVRTAVGKATKGTLSNTRSDEMKKIRLLLVIAAVSCVTIQFLSCSGTDHESTTFFDKTQLERYQKHWAAKNIRNYKMLIGAWGFKPNYSEQVLIEVRNGIMTSINVLWESGGGSGETSRPFDTVEKIFDLVAVQGQRSPKKFEVKYDRELGYPTSVEIDQDGDQGNEAPILVRIKSLEIIEL